MAADGFDESKADESLKLIGELERVSLHAYRVVGNYVRHDPVARNLLKDIRDKIVSGLRAGGIGQENYLIWGSPGSGKTSLIEELGNSSSNFAFRKLKLSDLDEKTFRKELALFQTVDGPLLCLVDEVDSKPLESWPNDALLTPLEKPLRTSRTCFVLVGSGGSSISELKQLIAARPKGDDILRRVTFKGEYEVPRMNLADRILVALSHLMEEARKSCFTIHEVEKLALLYIALNRQLASPSKISDLAVSCIRRIPSRQDRVRYDHLFEPGDVESKQFWQKWHEKCTPGLYIYVDDDYAQKLWERDVEENGAERGPTEDRVTEKVASTERRLKEPKTVVLVDNNSKIAKYRAFLEIFLRGFVSQKLEEHYGEEWWRKGVPKGVQEKCDERRQLSLKHVDTATDERPIDFADFLDIKEILLLEKNWHDVFRKYFGEDKKQKHTMERFFLELYRIRNDEAHSRKISPDDVRKFVVYSQEILCIAEKKDEFMKLVDSLEIPLPERKETVFEDVETWVAKNSRFPRKEDFDEGLVYSDEKTKKTILNILDSKRCCLLYGAPASRKTTFSLAFGLDLLKEGYAVLYFGIRGEQDVERLNLTDEINSRDVEKLLYIVDDCHKSTSGIHELAQRITRETKNAKFLFVSRKVSVVDPDYDYFKGFALREAAFELQPMDEVFKGIIQQFCASRQIENYMEIIGDLKDVMKICGNNILFLNYLLETWQEILETNKRQALSSITKEGFYEKISRKYSLAENRDIFKLCAIYQFEIPIFCDFALSQTPPDKIKKWLEEGLIFEESRLPCYSMPHSSLARVILRAGETRRLLMLEGDSSSRSLEEYTIEILTRYLRVKAVDLPRIISNIYRDEEIRIADRLLGKDLLVPAVKNYFDGDTNINLKINFLASRSYREFEEPVKKEIVRNLDLNKLVQQVNSEPHLQFQQLTSLLRNIGDRQKELIDKLDFKKFAEEISNASSNKFQDIANLLETFDQSKTDIIEALDYNKIKEKASQVAPSDIRGLILFMARLDKEHRDMLIRDVDWASLTLQCTISANSLRALGGILENLWKQANMLHEENGKKRASQHLRNHENDIAIAVEDAFEHIREHLRSYAPMYAGVGKFLWHYAQTDRESALKIIHRTRNKLTECFKIAPPAYKYAGQLVNVFNGLDPDLSYSFLSDNKIRGRIIWSINNHDQSANVDGLKHLVEAIYRSAPKLWKVSYLRFITVDLAPLGLDSVYRKVDEEKTGVLKVS